MDIRVKDFFCNESQTALRVRAVHGLKELDAFSVFSMCDILRLMNIFRIHRVFESPKTTQPKALPKGREVKGSSFQICYHLLYNGKPYIL